VCSQRAREQPTALPILARACQHLWLVGYDGAYGSSLGLDFHSACPSNRIDARSCRNRLTVVSSSQRRRDVVSVASDPTVTSRTGTNRLPRTEPWVRLTNLFSYRTITVTSSLFHTHALPLRNRMILRLAQISPMITRSPASWMAQRLARHLVKCFAQCRVVANVGALEVASHVANHVANPVLTVPLITLRTLLLRMLLRVVITLLPIVLPTGKLASRVACLTCWGGVRTFAAACGWRSSLACLLGAPGCRAGAAWRCWRIA